HRFFRVRHWLMTSGQINNGKPPEPESERPGNQVAFVVGTTMDHRLGHPPDRVRFDRFVPDKVKLAANAAHFLSNPTAEDRRPRTES
ncbi:MAG TPA: hypothetical protein VFQ43_21675, partial [Nitrososphaera sp.]|nr:hypothetical protein [Nitrososphaera sp.]